MIKIIKLLILSLLFPITLSAQYNREGGLNSDQVQNTTGWERVGTICLLEEPAAIVGIKDGTILNPALAFGSDLDTGLFLQAGGTISLVGDGVESARFEGITAGVNHFLFTPSITGARPVISVVGTDTDIGFSLAPKGTGIVEIKNDIRFVAYPNTRNDGTLINIFGTDASGNLISSPVDISCKVTKSADQTISNSTSTIITWDQENYDTDGMHDNVTNNSRITIKTAGKYSVMAQYEWTSNSTGKRIIDIMKNSVVLGKANYLSSGNSQHTISFIGDFVVDDILEVRVFQDSGGSLDFLDNIIYFEVHKIN